LRYGKMKKFEVWEEHDRAFIRTWGILMDLCQDCGNVEGCSPHRRESEECWRPKGTILVWEDEECMKEGCIGR
jgi:hypothetical protein